MKGKTIPLCTHIWQDAEDMRSKVFSRFGPVIFDRKLFALAAIVTKNMQAIQAPETFEFHEAEKNFAELSSRYTHDSRRKAFWTNTIGFI